MRLLTVKYNKTFGFIDIVMNKNGLTFIERKFLLYLNIFFFIF